MEIAQGTRTSLISTFAEKIGVEPAKLLSTLKQTVFKQPKPRDGVEAPEITDAQMMALLAVANQYGLDPFTKQIFAFPDKGGGIIPVVSVDGWVHIINSHPALDGFEFVDHKTNNKLDAITCRIYRKDRTRPIEITEYMDECKRNTDPWNKSPSRMLRHKALIQCGRYAFGFSGIYEQDEAERINERDVTGAAEVRRNGPLRQIEPQASETVVINGKSVDTSTGEVSDLPENEDATEEQQDIFPDNSPGFKALLKKLDASNTEQEINIVAKSSLLTKCSASERAEFFKLCEEKKKSVLLEQSE